MPGKPFLDEYLNDVFVSYAHIDNQPFGDDDQQWVSDFFCRLETRVAQVLGAGVCAWMDQKLRGNDEFGDELTQQLRRVAALVCVVSPRYLNSSWCRKELEEFLRAAARNAGVRVENRSRVFKVLKTHVPRAEEPASLQGQLGYPFYFRADDGKAREFHLAVGNEHRRAYWTRLDDLAHDLATLLCLMRPTNDNLRAVADTRSERRMYLAETSSDLSGVREQIRRDFERRGYTVLPDRSLPLSGAAAIEAIEKDLGTCRLSVHPLGSFYGVSPEGETRSIPHLAIDLAAARLQDPAFTRVVWIPRGSAFGEDRQANYVTQLRESPVANGRSELLEVSVEALKTHVMDRLDGDAEATRTEKASVRGDEPIRVHLVCHAQDEELAAPVRASLAELGFSVSPHLGDASDAERQALHRDYLVNYDAVLIFHGRASEAWLAMKMLDLVKARGWGREEQFAATAVYLGPPGTPAKQAYSSNEAIVISGEESFSAASLAPFCAALAGAKCS